MPKKKTTTKKRRPAGRKSTPTTAGRQKPTKPDGVLDGELVAMLEDMLTAEERERILGRAEAQLSVVAGALRGAWTRDDLTAVQRDAHQLAGLAGTTGCVGLLEIARRIEAACGRLERNAVGKHVAALDAALPAAIEALRTWRLGARG